MAKVYAFLAEGLEEVECLAVVDVLRRSGVEVTMVSVSGKKEVTGSHGIRLMADALFEEAGSQEEEDIRPHVIKYIRKFPELDAVAVQKTCAHFYRKGYPAGLIRKILEETREKD